MSTVAQKEKKYNFLQSDIFYGFAIEHDKKLATAIQGNPYGLILSYNFKNTASKEWTPYYNYPDFGFSAIYQNTNSSVLGEMYGLLTHYNFYLKDRNAKDQLALRIAFGLGYNTKPYDETTNPDNFAIGSHLSAAAYVKLNYQREFLKNKLGLNTGLALIHFSNSGFQSPNLGLNTLVGTIGLNYNIEEEPFAFPKSEKTPKVDAPIDYSFIFRTGVNESTNLDSKKYGFYVLSFELQKQINQKSILTAGTDYFVSNFLTDFVDEDEFDQTLTNRNNERIGLYVGHELKLNKLYTITQLGYNVYYPKKYVTRIYERFGFKYYLNNYIFTSLTLKINLFKAEALEFGVGIKL